ncbi:MAG: hypothetical protein LBH24_04900 [Clostridiales bacterium]|jgi:hypothetical protein|nr:hypothetical protein [Clostridiales bacterium]
MEKEISFGQILLYVLRKWFILSAGVVVGAVAGILYSVTFQTTDIRVYESTIHFSAEQYTELYLQNKEDGHVLSEAELSLILTKSEEVIGVLTKDTIKTTVFDQLEREGNFYPKETKRERERLFFSNFAVAARGATADIMFAYDIEDGGDETFAKSVVGLYIEKAQITLAEHYRLGNPPAGDPEEIEGSELLKRVVKFSAIQENKNTKKFEGVINVSTNQRPSLLVSLPLGAVIGLIGGVLAGLVVYFFDPRIKSIRSKMNDENDRVIGAVGPLNDDPSLYFVTDTCRMTKRAPGVLFVAKETGAAENDFVSGYARHLAVRGEKTLYVDFSSEAAGEPEAHGNLTVVKTTPEAYFDGQNRYAADAEAYGAVVMLLPCGPVAGYAAAVVKNAVFLIDHRRVKMREYVDMVEQNAAAGAGNLGTVVYNRTASYLD